MESLERQVREKEEELEQLRCQLRKAKRSAMEEEREGRNGYWNETIEDSNPYSRLEALRKMKVVPNIERITEMTVVVVGIGGVGSVAAEMLTRSGIGKLILYDCDTVELANMNRLFYTPSQQGMKKTDAAIQTLSAINPHTQLEGHCCDITKTAEFQLFIDVLRSEGTGGSKEESAPVDLVLSCVDNYGARVTVNRVCNRLDMPWMESGVSEDAMHGHTQFVVPGRTACYECSPPFALASGMDEKSIVKEGVCAASLSTTMSIISGLLAHNALKFLLSFGDIAFYQSYNSLKNFMPCMTLKPSLSCSDPTCIQRQRHPNHEWFLSHHGTKESGEEQNQRATGTQNDWGITLVSNGEDAGGTYASGDIHNTAEEERETGHLQDLVQSLQDIQGS